jgi:hypothetical protein
VNRADLPLSDWRSQREHDADECESERCPYCGCCVHGKTVRAGCKVEASPSGMRCPDWECGCEGKS